jgi:hypothetical protein
MKANYYFMLIFPVLVLGGCASSHLLPDGTYLYQFKAEQRSLFGTNTTVTRAATCQQDITKLNDWTPEYTEAIKQCRWLQADFHDAASQGQGGQIAAGALQGPRRRWHHDRQRCCQCDRHRRGHSHRWEGALMPGDVGLVSKAIETIFSYFTDEDGYKEMAKRSALKKAKKECTDALARNDWAALDAATTRLRDLSAKP